MGACSSKNPKAAPTNPAAPSSGGNSKSEHNSRPISSRSELTTNMIRERTADVWNYYEEVRRLGEGSIGAVSLVRRKKGTEGGSAYNSRRHTNKRAGKLTHGMFGCSCFGSNQSAAVERNHSTKTTKSLIGSIKTNNSNNEPHSLHSEEYALKSIQLRLVQKQYLDELRNEISILRSLDHPNIVKAYEVYESKKNIYVVMEYCSGGDLYARAPYTESAAAGLMRQLCSAINHMHKNGVCHRDLKFENIMFESKGDVMARIKVLDFGLSKKFLPGMSEIMTEGVGTVYTMAPQVFQGIYTPKADCWSIGVIAFILLCQEKPFRGKKRSQVVHKITKCRYDFNAPGWAHVSKEAKQFVSSLLVLNPSTRLSAAAALDHPWLAKKEFPLEKEDLRDSLMTHVNENILSYATMSELKKIAAVIVAHKSSVAEILDMREAFDNMDSEQDGVISMGEFKTALAKFSYTDDELDEMFSQMDFNQTGVIHYTEFVAATLELHGRVEEKRLAEAFDLMDDDDSGYISKEDLIKLLGNNVSPERIKKLIEQADVDGDGMISFEEFLTMFRKDNSRTAKKETNGTDTSDINSHTE